MRLTFETCLPKAAVVFGLNALNGRKIGSYGSAGGVWNSTNAESLMRYTVNKGYTIHGWELGGIGTRVAADQYASDIITLQAIVDTGFEVKPLVLAPGGFYNENWFSEFIDKTPESLQVVSHHIYNLGPGVDDHLTDKILNPSYLTSGSQPFSGLQQILQNSASSAVSWVGEAGGAYNSGRNLVTNAFVFSFCALLWHRLMGSNVLSTSFSGTTKIRAYTHCSKRSQGITVLLINLDGNTTVKVQVSTENAASHGALTIQQQQTQKTKFARMSRDYKVDGKTREEYHLTAKDGDIHSQTMLLNGEFIWRDSSIRTHKCERTRSYNC
ncbi:hypothetical protein Ddye_006458 [Dipteronia dyeriana]|uniref:Uncharacterized protein n=1 Tax=Dipteronia dyeriana TaxID=168575 RepID=A0AAD9XI36_9ROSI|nr:hypothetical protein Ddye_006458 [Dipteronia dyeriana]